MMKQDDLVHRIERADKYVREHGFSCEQVNGQRVSINRTLSQLPQDIQENEVFVGKIPRNVYEDELIPFVLKAGQVYKIRLMMDFGNTNRGYAFVRYVHAKDALHASRVLDNKSIRPGEPASGVCPSFDNKRLFFGNLPRLSEKELFEKLSKVIDGIDNVKLHTSKSYGSNYNQERERCYAYVSFKTHNHATKARRLLVPGTVKICGEKITVDWAKTEGSSAGSHWAKSSSSLASSLSASMESQPPSIASIPPVAMNTSESGATRILNHNQPANCTTNNTTTASTITHSCQNMFNKERASSISLAINQAKSSAPSKQSTSCKSKSVDENTAPPSLIGGILGPRTTQLLNLDTTTSTNNINPLSANINSTNIISSTPFNDNMAQNGFNLIDDTFTNFNHQLVAFNSAHRMHQEKAQDQINSGDLRSLRAMVASSPVFPSQTMQQNCNTLADYSSPSAMPLQAHKDDHDTYWYADGCTIVIKNPNCTNMDTLRQIFELNDRLAVVNIVSRDYSTLEVHYEKPDDATLMSEILTIVPQSFRLIVKHPDQIPIDNQGF